MKKERRPVQRPLLFDADFACGAVSACECTGLIPSAPASRAELDSYRDIAGTAPRKRAGE